jgi:DNA-binding CsgD family transcriptional regulator
MERTYDDAGLLKLVGEVVGLLDVEELRTGILTAFHRAMPLRWASLNEVGPGGVVALVDPELDAEWYPRFAALAHENPLYQRWQQTLDGRAYRFSDVTTREDLEATELYREVYAPLGINHQIAFTLPSEPDRILAIVLHREDRDFSDAERDFCNRARPFLIQAYRNATAHEEARRQGLPAIEPALEAGGLTSREAQVMRHVALGGSNRDVGARLGLSERTVQKHLERAFRKLGVATRSEAAARAWEMAGQPAPSSAPAGA